MIQNKQVYRKEKLFRNRDARLQNATSFFISNLPESCDKNSLWKAFEHLDNLEDTFVPCKKDRAGNKFGFIKLSNVTDPVWWMEKMKEVRIDGASIGVNLARFNRDGSKVETANQGNRMSVFNRLYGLNPIHEEGRAPVRKASAQHGVKSDSSVVKNKGNEPTGGSLALPPMHTESKKLLEFKSLVGEVKDIDILNGLKEHLSGLTEKGLKLKYLGGLKVLLCFDSPDEAEEFRYDMVNEWERWFSRLYLWDGIPPIFERVAWIKILGVPICLWDRHVFNKIGERCGRLLVKSEAESSNGNMAEERLAILVHSGKRISMEFDISWKEHNFKVWVEEIAGQWCPSFLDNDGSSQKSLELSSVYGVSSVVGVSESKSQVGDSSDACMGRSNSPLSPVFEDHGFEGIVHEAHAQPHANFIDERENNGQKNDDVGPEINNLNSMDRNGSPREYVRPSSTYFNEDREFVGPEVRNGEMNIEGGPNQEPSRPSFITTRPKRKSKSNKQKITVGAEAQVFDIPDLNKQVESDGDSDPFNINDIFRLEEEAARAGANKVIEREFLDSMEENQGETSDYLNFEAEVAHTMDFGYRLGIEVDGFENHVKKLVSGELELRCCK
ncbi:putative RNA recognition motif domain, nucleotide-binding alpha-beta plait domain superfamily [Helianthus annuus]|uniref:RNA recognition motif domain, nucleotide-binding alpha-beta plait domain superfamily n=2 Tax=Helianthus annuus TaxID=4232 RepID=A0A9K3NKV4_HELAN|nr:putative RNA recognition motif domain, nucleotide-binding alpha-beta plait domain superfamily [Helianthus annuus]KAJ0921277.1 putative RNA recognition motif domain, nucleotide-binding alpha-beta plait domain superfamily [Helianthus annuus]